ncbi:hypothetical protein V8C42DRAFT_336655 [Trichoderma barbatum]
MATKVCVAKSGPPSDVILQSPLIEQIAKDLPPILFNYAALGEHDKAMMEKEMDRLCTKGLFPNTVTPEHKTLAFLCSSLYLNIVDKPLNNWVASPQGDDLFRQMLRGFQRKETREQICLRVLALVGYGNLLPYSSSMSSSIPSTCLADFGRLLEDGALDVKQDVLICMATSIHHVMGNNCKKVFAEYFKKINSEEYFDDIKLKPLFSSSGKASDKYWGFRLEGYNHTHAWELVWRK